MRMGTISVGLGSLWLLACSVEPDPSGTTFSTTDPTTTATTGPMETSSTGTETTDTGTETTTETGTESESESTTGPEPEGVHAIAMDEPAPRGIAVDATHVYWTNELTGRIWRVENTGGEPELLAEGQGAPYAIAVDSTHAYWTDAVSGGKVLKLDTQNGGFETLATGTSTPKAMAIDTTHVFWVDASAVRKVAKDGTGAMQLATGNGILGGITVNGDYVYWTDHDGSDMGGGGGFIPPPEDEYLNGQVLRLHKSGGTPTQVIGAQEFPYGIDTDTQSVYWANNDAGGGGWTQINQIEKAPLAGGVGQVLASDQDAPWAVLVHGEWVYYGTKTALWRVDRNGNGAPEMIAEMQYLPRYMTVDNNAIYWANGDGSIMKLAFP